jgi:hypothetical protein
MVTAACSSRPGPIHADPCRHFPPPRLVHAGSRLTRTSDVSSGSRLIKSGINARTRASDISCCSGLIHSGIPTDISCRSGLVESPITGEQRSRQYCDHRTDDQCCNPLFASSFLVHLSLLQFVSFVSSFIG